MQEIIKFHDADILTHLPEHQKLVELLAILREHCTPKPNAPGIFNEGRRESSSLGIGTGSAWLWREALRERSDEENHDSTLEPGI